MSRETECRRCRVYCTWVVRPASCIERGCERLYLQEDGAGRRFVGCLQGVFAMEVDLDVLDEAERRPGGFGALRCAREPLPICASSIERAYPRRVPELGCVNPEFAEPVAGGAFRVVGH